MVRTFFVPKLCNHCVHPPCVQVCPVGATFSTQDGVVLIDRSAASGAATASRRAPTAPGTSIPGPRRRTSARSATTASRKGLLPACVEVCPTQARIFGDLKSKASRLVRFPRMNKIHVLKPALNTEPKVYYAQLDGEVR